MFISALFKIARIWKDLNAHPTEEWIKMWCIYTMEYHSAIKKDGAICSNMDGPRDCHAK